ncbi:FtsX-like permease family protein [Rathayibacter iranicus]|uniref:ABC3 transporter permease C-terminal domain-containing protein n=2 Tax=Rathayibacter iranicus TaxID=59737 RepID=A0AAD1AEB2_9MICO|nr:FtsX-like permease family protein [Rathayibacter iranicus]AZZ56644.1 hypothetical protein C7V51_12740 [Rathayibacter iranicus]MWV31322.1 FtsX-like permease family protein [Rathayibacter iranicus NCPPB 2253 = VKM Ac-1602]PPI43289.1 hypothetical protein C5E09_11660 [Rathayibacter iranicus]PPI58232.1 hypothetical protein C5E08_12575 [Rathayibacter iranicus]PPI69444.1 hypothetical protein C5E01_11620 [Rathayibacter iranicus]
MIRLILADLRTDVASRLGPFVTIVGAALVLAFGISMMETATTLSSSSGAMVSMAMTTLVGSVSTSMLVVGAVSKLAIDLRRQEFAAWRLAGVQPRAVRNVILGQSVVVALAGSVLGAALATQVVPGLLDAMLSSTSTMTFSMRFGPASAIADVLVVTVLVLASSIPAARRASRTEPLTALRESTTPPARMTWRRWLVVVALLGVVALMVQSMGTQDLSKIIGTSIGLSSILVLVAAALGPLLFPATVRLWTALLPARLSPAWYLARHNARHDMGLSTAAVTPLMISVALIGGFFAAIETATNTISITHELTMDYFTGDSGSILVNLSLLIGPPIALSLLGSAVVVLVAGRDRYRRNALLRAAGATDGTIIASSIGEAAVHAVTALLLGTGVVAVATTTAACAISLGRGIVVLPSIPVAEPGAVFGFGLVLVLAATLLPTLHSLRTPVPRALAAE